MLYLTGLTKRQRSFVGRTQGNLKEEIKKSLKDARPVMWAWAGGQNECDALIEETALGQSRVLDGRRGGRQVSVGGVTGENLCEKKTKRQEKQRRGEQLSHVRGHCTAQSALPKLLQLSLCLEIEPTTSLSTQ